MGDEVLYEWRTDVRKNHFKSVQHSIATLLAKDDMHPQMPLVSAGIENYKG
jgi:hypothetical protein